MIYFIQAGGAVGSIKIGFSDNPSGRISNLQVGNSKEIRLLAVWPGTKQDEHRIHRIFQHLRLRGEWFQATWEVIEFAHHGSARLAARLESQIVERGTTLRKSCAVSQKVKAAFRHRARHLLADPTTSLEARHVQGDST